MNCNCTNVSIIIHPSCHNFFITSISILITKEFSPKGEKLVKKVHKPLQDVQYSGELVTVEEKWLWFINLDCFWGKSHKGLVTQKFVFISLPLENS